MKLANETEEKCRKALDDLALALKEVSSEGLRRKRSFVLHKRIRTREKGG